MKAIFQAKYGSPDVLEYKEVAKPTPQDKEVLIKIYAASLNVGDWHMMRGDPLAMRFSSGLFKPKNPILGLDMAGRIEAVGSNVKNLKVGDEVYGELFKSGLGAFAEYACGLEDELALKPANISFAEAAAVPVAGVTALQSLQKGQLQAGQHVLVNGASGAVGTFTVQIAKAWGAEVTAVCSTAKIEQTRALGADHIIDYTQENVRQHHQEYDLVIDNVGNLSARDMRDLLVKGGKGVAVGFTSISHLMQFGLRASSVSKASNRHIMMLGPAQANTKDLVTLSELLNSGKIKPVIEKTYPLSETPAAIRYLEEGHAFGKLVINIGEDNHS